MFLTIALEKLIDIAGPVIFKMALEKAGFKNRDSSALAKAIVRYREFPNIDKGEFVSNEDVFKQYLEKIKDQNLGQSDLISFLEKHPEKIGLIQKYILENPFIPQRESTKIERHKFLILGHSHAGKTCYLYRLLYYLSFHHDIRVLMSYKDTEEVLDSDERFFCYDQFLTKLTTYNTMLNKGEIFGKTPRAEKIYLDLEFLKLNKIFRLEFFDYSGEDLKDMEAFKNLIVEKKFDGVLVLIDTYRLLATFFRNQAFKHNILDENKFLNNEKLKDLVTKNVETNIDHGPRIMLRILQALKSKTSVPISFVFTKFDSFDAYHTNHQEVKKLLQQRYQSSILQLAHTRQYPLAVSMISAFGNSKLKIESESDGYDIDDIYTGLPIFLPNPSLNFDGNENIALPFLFLIQNYIKKELLDEIDKFKNGFNSLPILARFNSKTKKLYHQKLAELYDEVAVWEPKIDEKNNFIYIEQNSENPKIVLSQLFNNA